MNEELMDKIIEKCKEDAAYAEAFDHLLKVSQAAALAGFSNEELASVCMMGWMVGMNPDLSKMINNISKISEMGLDIVDK